MFTDNELLYYHHCFTRTYFVNGDWLRKLRCRRCPLCARHLQSCSTIPGVSDDGWELCPRRNCNYQRQVFSAQEMQQLRW